MTGEGFNLLDRDWQSKSVIRYQCSKQVNEVCFDLSDIISGERFVDFSTKGADFLELLLGNELSLLNK